MTRETIVARIQALLAKARDAGATEAEAAAAAAAAERLLARHALSMRDVQAEDISGHDSGLRYLDPWIRNMAVHAARLYGCEPLVVPAQVWGTSKKTGLRQLFTYRTIRVYGRESSATVAVSMIGYLYDTVIRMSRSYSSLRREQLQFQRGCGERIASRLYELRLEQQSRSTTQEGRGDGTSLVVVEQSEAEAYVAERLATYTARRTSSDTRSRASHDGWAAGESVSLGGQVGSSGAPQRALT